MFVVISTRIVKRNTGAVERFAPRTANHTSLHVSGPFESAKTAQRAVLAILSTHTALDAEIWNAEQVRERAKEHIRDEEANMLRKALRLLDAILV